MRFSHQESAPSEVFSPGIRTQLKGAVGAAGQGWSGSSGTSVSAPRRRLLTGGIRPSLAQGLDLQRCLPNASSEGESWWENLSEVFSPAIHTQLNGAVGAAGQGCSGPSGTSVAAPRRRLLPGGIRHSLAQGLDLQRCPTQASADGESW